MKRCSRVSYYPARWEKKGGGLGGLVAASCMSHTLLLLTVFTGPALVLGTGNGLGVQYVDNTKQCVTSHRCVSKEAVWL
jgi:hypothetical protein